MAKYILAVDQSTQGTKALLFDEDGKLVKREDMPHRQIVSEEGYVSHDPEEIYQNTLKVVRKLMETSGVPKNEIAGLGISNQRETALVWDKKTSKPQALAIVWQCARSWDICKSIEETVDSEIIRNKTGLILSPYFPASKFKWLLEHVDGLKERAEKEELCFGTVDTWLVYRLTGGTSYKTDYSNASRTQLFNIKDLVWDQELCKIFGLKSRWLAEVSDSDSFFGMTDFEGLFDAPIPIHSVMGDSHGALFSQGCLKKGMTKATYGTGSSIMMNTGKEPVFSTHGVVTSLAWCMGGKVNYILEGNINYTGAVITWLKEKMNMISSPEETEQIAGAADQNDKVYLIPAFTGLGAPYWDSRATASISGMTRTTGRAEIVRAGLESIGYQITDVIQAMCEDMNCIIPELRVDGGSTENQYLMQFQSDILGTSVRVSEIKELSGMGAAFAAGISLGIYQEDIFEKMKAKQYNPSMGPGVRAKKYEGWRETVRKILA
ncbi:FGGY-family carbohydrate kinase [Lacrimispora sp.]|uniref:FGGY-family carbohydrate kinase n=1 Tax=Lacrimispora sp. TaxID=2719234 RepID=UPI0028AF0BFF|nr:glycerol kinase [Lacrimispora sp.]